MRTSIASSRTFLDTNVLVYMFDSADLVKQDRALAAFASVPAESAVISAQVLSEFASACSRLADPLSHDDIDDALASLSRLSTVPVSADLVLRARAIRKTASVSHWDAQIIAAAADAGCERILTEDLQHGQAIAGIRIESPFA